MRRTVWTLVAISATSLAVMACGGGEDSTSGGGSSGDGGSGGNGGAGSGNGAGATVTTGTPAGPTTTTTGGPGATTTTATTASTASGNTTCGVPFQANPCGDCLGAKCCDSAEACLGDIDCSNCLDDTTAAGCDQNAKLAAFESCYQNSCATECGVGQLPPPACGGPATPPSGGTCVGAVEGEPAAGTCAKDYDWSRFGTKACEECIETTCCAAVDACAANANCDKCINEGDETACNDQAALDLANAVLTCAFDDQQATNCATACNTINIQCNPLTNAGCDATQICFPNIIDDDATGESFYLGYQCYLGAGPGDPPADQACGDTCGPTQGYCAPGNICSGEGKPCYEFCCTDADCGGGGTCGELTEIFGGIGLCFAP